MQHEAAKQSEAAIGHLAVSERLRHLAHHVGVINARVELLVLEQEQHFSDFVQEPVHHFDSVSVLVRLDALHVIERLLKEKLALSSL